MKIITHIIVSTLLLFMAFATSAEEVFPLSPPDTSTPKATFDSFNRLVSTANHQLSQLPELPTEQREATKQSVYALFNKAVQCFDFSQQPKSEYSRISLESVMLMKEILDRIPAFDPSIIPDSNQVQQWTVPNTQLVITKQPNGQFLFSAQTVDSLHSNYQLIKHLPNRDGTEKDFYRYFSLSAGKLVPPAWFAWIEDLPPVFMLELAEQAVWQWLGLVTLSILLCMYSVWVYRSNRLTLLRPLLMAVGLGLFIAISNHQLNLTGQLMSVVSICGELVIWLLIAQAAYLLGYKTCSAMAKTTDASNLRQSITQIIGTLVGSALAVSIFGYGLSRIGVPVYGIVTGLSLGGMAIALAIRPTMENLIGGVILFLDKSLSVGDYCQMGKVSGVVERIGVRSTRIRAKDRTQITIANGDLVKMEIINYSRRDRYPFKAEIALRFGTPITVVTNITHEIEAMLVAHPDTLDSPVRVHFSTFDNYRINLEILAHLDTTNRERFLELQQELLFSIERIIKQNNAEFAIPIQATILQMASGKQESINAEKLDNYSVS
ncbi:mechanosensitive ion channel family protein [Vibrio bivalvicida]|uniref:Mechanosensitive ion channel protein MscS n=1 Tax=Vibrio bivalvicida TaxID=1276888 RepID=A0A177XWG1_9VIBR|nr:mechanosensitive ion channel family protein [Vibrio bivalvicida]OAJ92605.1 mechanosensitive ion channel protein MscS [Vibrio bivalvicida]